MTPSPPAQAEASETVEQQVARLIPDKGCSCNQGRLERLGYHDAWCPMHYRPGVAAALQEIEDKSRAGWSIAKSRAERIAAMHVQLQSERDSRDSLQAENERLRAELLKAGRALSVGGCKWKSGCLRPKAWEHMPDTTPELAAELDASAQAALATLGEK